MPKSVDFQNCVSQSKEWESRLEKGLRLWRNLQQKAQPVEEWVTEAVDVLHLQGEPTTQLIQKHKVSFNNITLYYLQNSIGNLLT